MCRGTGSLNSSESLARKTHDNTSCMGLSNFASLEEFDHKDSEGEERCAGGAAGV